MQEIRDLSAADLERLVKRLVHHAKCRMRYLTTRGAPLARSDLINTVEFVNTAFTRVFAGKRKWNKSKYVTLFGFLRSVVNSVISHAVESPENKHGWNLSFDDANDDEPAEYQHPSREANPATAVIDREWTERQVKFHEAAMKLLDGDQFLIDLLECMQAGITERSEIATVLGVPVEHVDNEKKRLKRKLEKLDTRTESAKKGSTR